MLLHERSAFQAQAERDLPARVSQVFVGLYDWHIRHVARLLGERVPSQEDDGKDRGDSKYAAAGDLHPPAEGDYCNCSNDGEQ